MKKVAKYTWKNGASLQAFVSEKRIKEHADSDRIVLEVTPAGGDTTCIYMNNQDASTVVASLGVAMIECMKLGVKNHEK